MTFRPSPDSFVGLLAETARRLVAHRVVEMSAALAFYCALSLAPLLIITLGMAGLLVDRAVLQDHVVSEADRVLGHGTGDLMRRLAAEQHAAGTGMLATITGGVLLLVGAMGVFGQLQDGLDRIWEVRTPPRRGPWLFLRKRLASAAMVASLGFLLLVSLLVSAVLSALADRMALTAGQNLAANLAHLLASMLVATLLFALVFQPAAQHARRLGRGLGRRRADLGAVPHRRVGHRPVPRARQRRLDVRRRGHAGRAAGVGLLLVGDHLRGGGVHARVLVEEAPPSGQGQIVATRPGSFAVSRTSCGHGALFSDAADPMQSGGRNLDGARRFGR